MYQKYLHSSSGEPTLRKYNGKSGCESNLLVRFNYTADPRDQRPKSQSTNLTVCSQTPKEETQNLPLEVSARLNGGVAQHGQWSLWTQPLLHVHILWPHRNMHGSLQRTFWGTCVYQKLAVAKCKEKTRKRTPASWVLPKLPKT